MPISTMCGREGFLDDSSAARSRFWRVGQANATNRAAVSQILRITLVMNRGPFAWYFLGPVGQRSPLALREDYVVGRPRTFFTLPPPRTADREPAPRPGGAVRPLLSSCPQRKIDRKRKADKQAFPTLCSF